MEFRGHFPGKIPPKNPLYWVSLVRRHHCVKLEQ